MPPRARTHLPGLRGFSRGGADRVRIELIGFDELFRDLQTVAFALPTAADAATAAGAEMTAEIARELHRPHSKSGETLASIQAEQADKGVWEVSVGTLQGRLLEYGFLHSGHTWVQYPFITPAYDMVIPLLFHIYDGIAGIAQGPVTITGPAQIAAPVNSHFTSIRSSLYSYSRATGDLRSIGLNLPGSGLAAIGARYLGDINSVMKSTIASRLTVRASGSWATHGIRANLTASVSTSVGSQFPVAARSWNRVAGRVIGTSFNRLNLPN